MEIIFTGLVMAAACFVLVFGAFYRIRPGQPRKVDTVEDRAGALLAIASFAVALTLAWTASPPQMFVTAPPQPVWAWPLLTLFAALWALPKFWRWFVPKAS